MKIRYLGQQDFQTTWQSMHDFTVHRDENTEDEIWLLQHFPVFTQGQAGKPEHILNPHNIPIIQTDRGGQVTYHGPGQIVAYILFDLKRAKIGVRSLVTALEQSIIHVLADHGVKANSECSRPGVYVNGEKIASIGLRVKKGCSYHGISFNVKMDLTPFSYINPCGFAQLKMTQLSHFVNNIVWEEIEQQLAQQLRLTLDLGDNHPLAKNKDAKCSTN